jgi:galactokinase
MTGGGFGGCIVALVSETHAAGVASALRAAGATQAFATRAAGGAAGWRFRPDQLA